MQQQNKWYSPDSDSGGSGQGKSSQSMRSAPPDSGGELGGAGGADGVGSNASGPANLNDDDLGVAGLGVANLESSAIGQSGPIDTDPLPDYDAEIIATDEIHIESPSTGESSESIQPAEQSDATGQGHRRTTGVL